MQNVRRAALVAAAFVALCSPLAAQTSTSFGITAGLNVGYHHIASPALEGMDDYGLGSISVDGALVSLYAGAHVYLAPWVLLSATFSGAGAGGYTWSHLLGLTGDFSMYVQVFDLIAEAHLTAPFLPGLYPYIGAGYTVASSIDDDSGSGFLRGHGLVLTAGLDLAFSPVIALVNDRLVICPRVGVLVRPSHRYGGFFLEKVPVTEDLVSFLNDLRAQGSTVTDDAATFFGQVMEATAFTVYAGIHVSAALGKKPA